MPVALEPAPAAAPALADLRARANAAAAEGDQDAALALWTEARQFFPGNPQPWLRCAEILSSLRRFAEAEAVLNQAVTRFPDNFWLARARANAARDQGDDVEAYVRFRSLRRTFPDDPTAHAGFVHLLLNQKRVAAAEAEAQASLARFPDSRWLLHAYARCADQTGDDAAAATRWTELLARHPDHDQAYPPAVRALLATGRLQEAAGIARAGARLLPASGPVREASDAAEKALPTSAEGAAEPALPTSAEGAAEQVLPASAEGAAGQALPASAEDAAGQALPTSAEGAAGQALPTSAEGAAEPVPAIVLLSRALRANSADAAEEAADAWDALLRQAPELPRASAGAARALSRLGRFAEAEIILARARRDLPADAGVWRQGPQPPPHAPITPPPWPASARYRRRFDAPAGAFGIARALRALGRLTDADAAFPRPWRGGIRRTLRWPGSTPRSHPNAATAPRRRGAGPRSPPPFRTARTPGIAWPTRCFRADRPPKRMRCCHGRRGGSRTIWTWRCAGPRRGRQATNRNGRRLCAGGSPIWPPCFIWRPCFARPPLASPMWPGRRPRTRPRHDTAGPSTLRIAAA